MDPLFAAYISFTAILVVTPGSTTAVVVRNALSGGRTAGIAAAVGAALGNTSHAALAGFGLAVIVGQWPVTMLALRIAGGAYLAWLGVESLYRVWKHRDGGLRVLEVEATPSATSAHSYSNSVRQGLLVNLLNPAIATFYLVVVPSFIPAGAPPWYFALLAMIHVAMALVCHGAWAVALDRLRGAFHAAAARRALEAATGVALIVLAARVLWQPFDR